MKKVLLTVAFLLAAHMGFAQGMTGASLLEIFKKGDAKSINAYLETKNYVVVADASYGEIFIVWGNNVAEYSDYGIEPLSPSKPYSLVFVNFTNDLRNATRVKYRTTDVSNMRNILAYFKKQGYTKGGTDYAGADVYLKNGSQFAFHYHEQGKTILVVPIDE